MYLFSNSFKKVIPIQDAIQTSIGIPDLTISGVTIQNGRCRADIPCVDGGGIRYAVDNQAVLTISDSTINNNRTEVNTANPANNGGGIFGGQSDFSFTNMTVTNNFTAFVSSGCTGATQCGGEGGGVFAGIRFTANPTSVTMTDCVITGNTVNAVNGLGGRGGAYAGSPDSVSITGGTFNGNTAFTDAGALRLFTPTTISGATISNNSARQNGGGIWSDPLANDNTPLTNTLTNLVMKGNTADSDGVIGVNNVNRGDGGAIFHGRGTLNLNNPTIGGTGAGEGNTAFDGGGIARTYSQFVSAVFNASTLNINNGGSIVGNLAINNGGGVINDATRTANNANSLLSIGTTTSVTITNNNARNHGGGIAVITNGGSPAPTATATLNNITLRNNTANSDNSGDGGAFYQNNNAATVGTTFTGTLTIGGSGSANSAANGGGIANAAGLLVLPSNASITFNSATGNGGGIFNGGTINSFSGATINSNSATTSGGGIFNNGTITVSGATINSNSATTGSSVTQAGGTFNSAGTTTLGNNLAITGGIFNAGSSTVNLGGNFSFTGGTFTQGTSTFNFNGSALQTISGTVIFNNLTVNNAAGVNLLSNETVGGTLTLTNGVLGVGSNTLTLNSTVSFTSGSIGSNSNGTVNYNQSSNGQVVLPGNYGNLTFSNFNKDLTNANIGIAGTFTPGSGTHTITGSTFTYNGTAAQTLPSGFTTYNNLTLNNPAGVTGFAGLIVQNLLRVQAGTFTSSSSYNNVQVDAGATLAGTNATTINISGNWTNNGTFTANGNTVNFNGSSAQTIGGSSATNFNNLTINNAAGVNLSMNTTVGAALTLTAGTLVIGSNTLTLNGAATATGGNLTSAANGTVNYNQGSNGQAILAANYGNLTFSNFNKTLPSGTVGIAGTFTPGSAVGHTVTGNTINFNGIAVQMIPVFNYNNLTLDNAAGASIAGNVTVPGALTLTNGILSTGANVLIVGSAGTAARTNGYVTSAAGGGLQKIYNAASSFTFPIGTTNGYSPATVNITAGTFPLDFTLRAVQSPHPTLIAASSLQRYWEVTPSAGGNPTGDLTFNYLQTDVMGMEANYRVVRITGGVPTTFPPMPNITVDTVNNIFSITGITSFSDWTLTEAPVTAASVSIGGRIFDNAGNGIANAVVSLTDENGNVSTARVSSFGYYRFDEVEVGQTYVLNVKHRRYQFSPQAIFVSEERNDLNFVVSP